MSAKKTRKESPKISRKGDESASILVNKRLYTRDVLFGTAFIFLDRCYIHLDTADKDHYKVDLRVKPDSKSIVAADLAGEFLNEMVNQAVRLKLAKTTELVRNTIVGRAIGQSMPFEQGSAASEPAIDLPPEVAKILEEEDDSLDFLDDPLGIAIPWEEKYGKDGKEEKKAPKKG